MCDNLGIKNMHLNPTMLQAKAGGQRRTQPRTARVTRTAGPRKRRSCLRLDSVRTGRPRWRRHWGQQVTHTSKKNSLIQRGGIELMV